MEEDPIVESLFGIVQYVRRLSAENERLREALRRIADYHPTITHQWAGDVRAIARAALGENKPLEDRWDNA